MANNDKRLQRLIAASRQTPAPEVDVVDRAMKSIRAQESAPALTWLFSMEAAFALLLAVCAAIPARQSVTALLDPMMVLFSSVEAAFR